MKKYLVAGLKPLTVSIIIQKNIFQDKKVFDFAKHGVIIDSK